MNSARAVEKGIAGAMKSRFANGGLVYSTEAGRMCPACRKPAAQCICAGAAAFRESGDGVVRISRETKGRGGKAVTLVRGLQIDAAAVAQLAQQLKTHCGCGGTVKAGSIEVQGDHCDKVMALLKSQGYPVKRAGS